MRLRGKGKEIMPAGCLPEKKNNVRITKFFFRSTMSLKKENISVHLPEYTAHLRIQTDGR
jgi:hypothetical protein